MVFFHKRLEHSVKFILIGSVSPSFRVQFVIWVQKFGKIKFKKIEKMLSCFAPEVKDAKQSIIYLTFSCKRQNFLEVLRAVGKKRKNRHHMKSGNSGCIFKFPQDRKAFFRRRSQGF